MTMPEGLLGKLELAEAAESCRQLVATEGGLSQSMKREDLLHALGGGGMQLQG